MAGHFQGIIGGLRDDSVEVHHFALLAHHEVRARRSRLNRATVFVETPTPPRALTAAV
jgi:hypothetical protein